MDPALRPVLFVLNRAYSRFSRLKKQEKQICSFPDEGCLGPSQFCGSPLGVFRMLSLGRCILQVYQGVKMSAGGPGLARGNIIPASFEYRDSQALRN
jgi:hypothetical protein